MAENRATAPREPMAGLASGYSPALDAVRFTATIAVVAVHVLAPLFTPESPSALLSLRALLATAVPAFIMISGALNLAPRAMRHGTARFLDHRLRRLLPAAIFWTAFYIVVIKILILPNEYGASDVVVDLLSADSYAHLYFLPLIIGLTVITPILSAYIDDSGRRAWWVGAVALLWTLVVMAIPFATEGVLGEAVRMIDLSALTYFLPFIGYYVLGRAMWIAPPSPRASWLLLIMATPLLIAATTWSYGSGWTQQPPGQMLLPTYQSPLVSLLSVSLTCGVIGVTRGWTVSPRTASRMRAAGDATFGVYLMHLAFLTPLQQLGIHGETPLSALAMIVSITVLSFCIALVGRRVPGIRLVL